jgi:hypothetical protein
MQYGKLCARLIEALRWRYREFVPANCLSTFNIIFMETIGQGTFSAPIARGSFVNDGGSCAVRTTSRRTAELVKAGVVQRSVVIHNFKNRKCSIVYYRLNLPGIMRYVSKHRNIKVIGFFAGSETAGIERQVLAIYKRNGWPTDKEVVPLEDKFFLDSVQERADVQSQMGLDKRKASRDKKPLNTLWIPEFMRDYCAEIGVPFYDDWIAKTRGCAKNWLRFCREQGKDPKEVLRKVCDNWGSAVSTIMREHPQIILLQTVSFAAYFKYRQHFEDVMVRTSPVEEGNGGWDKEEVWDESLGKYVDVTRR